jgi:transient receptor potential cation channel subfamily M protein 2
VFVLFFLQYVRVDHMTDVSKVWTVLTDLWRLPYPKLLISVTGGARRFHLKPRLKSILKQGLVNAAVSTGIHFLIFLFE